MDDKLRILLCEDDENLGMLLRENICRQKVTIADLFPDGEVGFKAFLKSKYDLVVTDVMMPQGWFYFGARDSSGKCRSSYYFLDC